MPERYIIIHCDDVGMNLGANEATKELLTKGIARSASVMMPCPWSYAFVDWLKQHPHFDVGVHATLTSEWKTYRWRPLARDVDGLYDEAGFMWHRPEQVIRHASPSEVKAEFVAQMQQALAWGMRPTHIDTHMGTAYSTSEFFAAYLEVALEFEVLPMLFNRSRQAEQHLERLGHGYETLQRMEAVDVPKLDYITGAAPARSYKDKKTKVYKQLEGLPAGATYFVIHPSLASSTLSSITGSWQQRHWEYQLFMDDETAAVLDSLNIKSVSWQELAGSTRE